MVVLKLATVVTGWFVVVMVAAGGDLGNGITGDGLSNEEWPCPPHNEIMPCDCTAQQDLTLIMDCSAVRNDEELVSAFDHDQFPLTYFQEFKIIQDPDNPSYKLNTIAQGTLGETTYQIVNIHGTKVQRVEDGAFDMSHTTLQLLDLSSNKLQIFPFESLGAYDQLGTFRIDNNNLYSLPPIESSSLTVFGASDNRGLQLLPLVFIGASALQEVHLAGCNITDLANNTFSSQTNLTIVDLERNEFQTLGEGTISPPGKSIQSLSFKNNLINYVRHNAINGEHIDRCDNPPDIHFC